MLWHPGEGLKGGPMARRSFMALAIRLAVYAVALVFVLWPEPRPEPSGPATAFRAAPEPQSPEGSSILRVTLMGVLLIGVAAECLARRPAWR